MTRNVFSFIAAAAAAALFWSIVGAPRVDDTIRVGNMIVAGHQ